MRRTWTAKRHDHGMSRRQPPEGRITPLEIYKVALDTRNLEINLFWQRCNYFLVLNSALVLAYFSIKDDAYRAPIAVIGIAVCVLWFQVALGSKYWHARWEQAMNDVERTFISKGLVAYERPLFSSRQDEANAAVAQSFGWERNRGRFARWIDGLVLTKPSVTQSMMVLIMVFLAAWITALAAQLLRIVG